MMLTKEGLIKSKGQFRKNVQMISLIDKMHLQRVEILRSCVKFQDENS